jgi:anti-sigma factor RsiW
MDNEASMSMPPCIRPGEINDDDLIGYVAGETSDDEPAGQRVRQHVAACPRCAALAAEYAGAERYLGRALFRVDCPPALTLGEYHLGLLPATTIRQIAAHLATCPHCTAELATAAGFLDDPAPAPVADLVRAAGETLRRIVATLLAPPVQPALALRGHGRAVSVRAESSR